MAVAATGQDDMAKRRICLNKNFNRFKEFSIFPDSSVSASVPKYMSKQHTQVVFLLSWGLLFVDYINFVLFTFHFPSYTVCLIHFPLTERLNWISFRKTHTDPRRGRCNEIWKIFLSPNAINGNETAAVAVIPCCRWG